MLSLRDEGCFKLFQITHGHPTQGGSPSCALKGAHQAPPFLRSLSSAPSPSPHSKSSPSPQSTRPEPEQEDHHTECCTSADSRRSVGCTPSSGCPSSPAARAAGGHSSSAPQLRLVPLSCRVRKGAHEPPCPPLFSTPGPH